MTATFRVVVISPPGYRHAAAFHEMAESLYHAIRSLGYPASVEYNRFAAGAIHIVLGSNLVGPSAVGEIPEGGRRGVRNKGGNLLAPDLLVPEAHDVVHIVRPAGGGCPRNDRMLR